MHTHKHVDMLCSFYLVFTKSYKNVTIECNFLVAYCLVLLIKFYKELNGIWKWNSNERKGWLFNYSMAGYMVIKYCLAFESHWHTH